MEEGAYPPLIIERYITSSLLLRNCCSIPPAPGPKNGHSPGKWLGSGRGQAISEHWFCASRGSPHHWTRGAPPAMGVQIDPGGGTRE